jgi:hypothetical protein
MSWGFNFRGSSGFVTDAVGTTYVVGDTYPTTRNGITFGWDFSLGFVNPLDRNAAIDARLAGSNYTLNNTGTQIRFRVDLPDGPGTRVIAMAVGDDVAGQAEQFVAIDDDTTGLFPVVALGGTAAGHFIDANSVDWATAAWPGSNTPVSITTTSSILRLRCGDGGTTVGGATTLAHLFIGDLIPVSGGPLIDVMHRPWFQSLIAQ